MITVEMEAAGLFTVGRTLGVKAASVFCISDVLHGREWEPHFRAASVGDTLWEVFETVESTLHDIGGPTGSA